MYNHFLYRLNRVDGTTKYGKINQLPSIKEWWTELSDLYSQTLQNAVERLYDDPSRLKDAKDNGRSVGLLEWKAPNEYRSFTYRQSDFELKNTSGQPVLRLSKIGEIPVRLHREVPDDAAIKQVTVKKEPTGEWFAIFGIETEDEAPAKPETPEKCVGIDVGILKYTHDTDGIAVGSLDLSTERERLEREQRLDQQLEPPSLDHPLGTDELGRDVLRASFTVENLARNRTRRLVVVRTPRSRERALRERTRVRHGVPAPRRFTLRVSVRHVLPNVAIPVVVLATLDLGGVILATAGLSFLRLGAQPPTPERGTMLASGRNYLREAWWLVNAPGAAIMLTVLGFNFLGDGLRDLLDPKQTTRIERL
ncbi:ABC transporter permease subunit [Halegenticoccus tardaugens]|uniref:ABC transporter permease subunit n=1 Tax=Halegenticoccus tardaugens TaxID=2071624 RepID=UPI003742C1CE